MPYHPIGKLRLVLHTFVMYDSLWYDNLTKPLLQPPSWIFSPVWIILYGTILAAVILYSVTITTKNKAGGYICFVIHMILNILWSPVFFYLHKVDIALIILFLMDFLAALMISRFFCVSKLAGIILFPYFIWLMFATYLNIQILILN